MPPEARVHAQAAVPVDRVEAAWAFACCALYLALAVATAFVWEPAHDEGVTFEQAIAPLAAAGVREPATPIEALYARLDSPHPPAAVLRRLVEPGGMHPPAYYLLINAWSRAFGSAQLSLALPALAAGVCALFALRALARALLGHAAGRWSMALLAVSPWFVGYSVLLRPYAIAVCIALLATLAALALARAREPLRPMLGFAALTALGLYTIYHYAFVALAHVLLLSLLAVGEARAERSRRIAWAAGSLGLAALLFAPWATRLLFHLEITDARPWYFSGLLPLADWPGRALLVLGVYGLGEQAIEVPASSLRVLLGVLAIGTFVCGAVALASRWRGTSPELRAAVASAVAIPVAIAASDLLRDTHTLFYSKTLFGLFPCLLLAIAAAISALRGRAATLLGAAWVGVFAITSVANVAIRARTTTDFEALAAHVAQESGHGRLHTIVVPTLNHGYFVPLVRALRNEGIGGVELRHVPAERFDAWLLRGLREQSGGRITLVNFDVVTAPRDAWSQLQVERAGRQARALGWGVRAVVPGAPPPGAAAGKPMLWVTPPLGSKFFSM